MRYTRLSEFTGGDAIRLAIALYIVKEVYVGISEVLNPALRRFGNNLDQKTRDREARRDNKSSERR